MIQKEVKIDTILQRKNTVNWSIISTKTHCSSKVKTKMERGL